MLVGIGLARFAYSPLIPAFIEAHWFAADQVAYLGAANLLGYLAGVMFSGLVTRGKSTSVTLRGMMLTTAFSLFACTFEQLGFAWFFLWRVVCGYAGGVIMLLAAPTVLAHTPPERRGIVGGAMFTGVGLGVAASGALTPLLLAVGGLRGVWIWLGLLALFLTLATWTSWPPDSKQHRPPAIETRPTRHQPAVLSLHVEYALNVIGLVPHMIFLVDFVARGLGRGMLIGAQIWILYGVGATLGPLTAGLVADRVGFTVGLRLALLTQAFVIALPAISSGPIWIAVSSAGVCALTIGIVPLVLGRVHDLVKDPEAQHRVWGQATTGFAIAQVLVGNGFSYLFSRSDSYTVLFVLGAIALVVALALDLLVGATTHRSPSSTN